MAIDKDLAARMFWAQSERERRLGHKLVLREIAEGYARELGTGKRPPDPSVVRRWLSGQQDPRGRREWLALARALDVDAGWLAFGNVNVAPEGYAEWIEGRAPAKRHPKVPRATVQEAQAGNRPVVPTKRPGQKSG